MAIPLDHAKALVASLNSDQMQHLFAQSHAKYVLNEVRELPENFPHFDPQLEDKVTFTAYAQLAAGCSILEQLAIDQGALIDAQVMTDGIACLEASAALLVNSHAAIARESRASGFHVLVASMAFYAAGHYSRAFVAIRGINGTTDAANMIAAFIRKDIKELIFRLNKVLLRDPPEIAEQSELDEWAVTLAIARSLAFVLEYLFTGEKNHIWASEALLESASVIAVCGASPSLWWTVRLLKLMLRDLHHASFWEVLPPFFGPEAGEFLSHYIRSHAFAKPPVVELWPSQRSALQLALDPLNHGAVINLRTSAGKTRIAELAILRTLSEDPTAKIVYLAPFRSLAFEIERTLSEAFSPLNFTVSHLYGGARASVADTEILSESSITIATPEKLRSLFRAVPDVFDNLKLIIIDEGHLIGRSARDIRNEIFIDHLNAFAWSKGARVLLLSAVLPNAADLAEWITGDQAAVAFSPWKPSTERFGLLRWNGTRARIDWLGKAPSFNPSFVVAKPISERKNSRRFPRTKNDAIAACAVRLTSIGPVMIFSGRAVSVPSLAESALIALGTPEALYPWPEQEWKAFEAVCEEELGLNAIEYRSARVGVICHSNRLPPQVRMSIEHLMRCHQPKIIIATTTLGQGVNVGISSVIVASPYIGDRTPIDKRDFWNICGRAGRAFIDGEGKVLYAVDDVVTKSRKQWHIKKDESLALHYFEPGFGDSVVSGILKVIKRLSVIAAVANVSFEVLLELVANNDLSAFGHSAQEMETLWDVLDDELLAMHENAFVNPVSDSTVEWVDEVFQRSLAVIQARANEGEASANDVILLLKARAASILKRIPNSADRKAIAASSLPLSIATKAIRDLDLFRGWADAYIGSNGAFETLIVIVSAFENWVRNNIPSIAGSLPDEIVLGNLRTLWLGGTGLRALTEQNEDAIRIAKDLYGYHLPWIINAIAQKLDGEAEAERIEVLARIALLTEIGVPSEQAAKIFLAGIRSRAAATELAEIDAPFGAKISTIRTQLISSEFVDRLMPVVSPATATWLELLLSDESYQKAPPPGFPNFTFGKAVINANMLHVRSYENKFFLCSCDGTEKVHINPSDVLPFDQVADNPAFIFTKEDDVWALSVRDPRYTGV